MVIQSVRHRGLRRLLEQDSVRHLPSQLGDRVRKVLTALVLAEELHDFVANAAPGGAFIGCPATGATWSVSVSGNWRMTFTAAGGRVHRLNLEDYH